MRNFEIIELEDSSVTTMLSLRVIIDEDPEYQRQSELWELSRKQLLIDSLINGYDIPKLYLHEFSWSGVGAPRPHRYAIIDGKQRLQTIWSFLAGEFSLSDEFEFVEDTGLEASGMSYPELALRYPVIQRRLLTRKLPIVVVRTEDLEVIEEMFSRLNEALPLNAPEKRNALGGPIPARVRNLIKHKFFDLCLPFGNNRYRHMDVATKFLFLEYKGDITDTKKRSLDDFVKNFRQRRANGEAEAIYGRTMSVVSTMSETFLIDDALLSSVGTLVVFYKLFRDAREGEIDPQLLQRKAFAAFEAQRQHNRAVRKEAEERVRVGDPVPPQVTAQINPTMAEYDRLMQSPNDAGALRFRYSVLRNFLEHFAEQPEEYVLSL